MQPSIQLKLSAEQQKRLKTADADLSELLGEVISVNSEQIGYLLQDYYPREKVRGVSIVEGSMIRSTELQFSLKLEFTLEEFNACSAINTEDRKQMPVTVDPDLTNGLLKLTGEYWPEL